MKSPFCWPSNPFDRLYNLSIELDGQHSEVKNISTGNDPSRGVGWVLIAMDGNGICNIGRNKSDIRNTKNQNFEISESWNDVSPEANVFYLKQNIILADGLVTLKLIRVAHGRSNFCFHKTNSNVVKY